jgi:hypothetical protein
MALKSEISRLQNESINRTNAIGKDVDTFMTVVG